MGIDWARFVVLFLVCAILCAFTFAAYRIVMAQCSAWAKVGLALALFGGWTVLEFLSILLTFFYGYCENCAGKPFETRDVLILLIVVAPTVVLGVASQLIKTLGKRNTV